MDNLIFQSETLSQLKHFISNPSGSIIITGAIGSGKTSTLYWMASQLLAIDSKKIKQYQYLLYIDANEKKHITVDSIRTINHFLSMKVPKTDQQVRRVILIDDADNMTLIAQNALLKNLEEPPKDTVFLLSTSNYSSLIDTILSRTSLINLNRLPKASVEAILDNKNISQAIIDQAIIIGGGLPGLTIELVNNYPNHPLQVAVEQAKQLLSMNRYERLCLINNLYKDKQLAQNIVIVLQHMARIALETVTDEQANNWQRILITAYAAEEYFSHNTNPKLTLTYLIMNL